ncbi:putative protein FAM47C [Gopherus flavomarginatus]|uniref:putative protein FAM47C n=1 Tax=Gopherus flavomarginatus TaxID=286002 RepID=UPI0021CBD366|nr:putative protein FAM47C [Gopherus flavomarginatus]
MTLLQLPEVENYWSKFPPGAYTHEEAIRWEEPPRTRYREEPPELPHARYWEKLLEPPRACYREEPPELPRAHYREKPLEPPHTRYWEELPELPHACCYPEEPPEPAWPDFPEELPDLPPSPGREEPMLSDFPGVDTMDQLHIFQASLLHPEG